MVIPENVLAVIPARGGSKSIPRKNIRPFGGHPLLAWSIAAAKQAKSVGRVIVSTDDPEIAEIAIACGAEAPFLRPEEIARDETGDYPVFEHALNWLESEEGWAPEIIVQLRPTSPLRPPRCVDDAVRLLAADPTADSVRAVTAAGQNPYKMWRIRGQHLTPLLEHELAEPYNLPRQWLPPTYWQTGHVEAIRHSTIRMQRSLTGRQILPLVIDPDYAVDIDTPLQWKQGEWVLAHGGAELVRP